MNMVWEKDLGKKSLEEDEEAGAVDEETDSLCKPAN